MRWALEVLEEVPAGAVIALRALYAELERRIGERAPRCEISGRCCRFREYGHELFLTALEAVVLVREGPVPQGDLEDEGGCPWQSATGLCTARDARPMGCRLYYCDPDFAEEMPELMEEFLGRLRVLVEAYGLPWSYGRLHDHLGLLLRRGDGSDRCGEGAGADLGPRQDT
jgi:hypothetical protein